jgi:hypothetical protein
MGTRSLTHIKDGSLKVKTLMTMYKQFDGYVSGYGQDLVEFLQSLSLVNGIGMDKKVANGMGCLAAQLIAKFKTEAGGIYVYPAGSKDCWEEYVYTVYVKDDKIALKIQTANSPKVIFNDTVDKFDLDLALKIEGIE